MRKIIILFIMPAVMSAADIDILIGVKSPHILGLNATPMHGTWAGYFTGGGAAVEARFFKGILGDGSMLSIELYTHITIDRYSLPAEHYGTNAVIEQRNIRNTISSKFWFSTFFFGVGLCAATTFAGETSVIDTTLRSQLTADALGTDLYAVITAGNAFPLADWLAMTMALQYDIALTIPNTTVMEFQFLLGLSVKFGL